MNTVKVFKSGNSQAVRITKEFHLIGGEVEIQMLDSGFFRVSNQIN